MTDDVVNRRLTLRVATRSGRMTVVAEARRDIEVDGRPVDAVGAVVTIASSSSKSHDIRVPVGTEVVIGTQSGRVDVRGPVGPVKVATESGRVSIEEAERADVRTQSGRIEIGTCQHDCRVHAESSRVAVGRARGVDIHTASGRVSVGRASGPMSVRTTSGRVSVGLDGPAEVDAETMSGRISVDVAPGLGVRMVESAGRRVENSAAAGDDCTIRTKAVNGRIQVRNR